jgi:hypothetical protein
VFLPFDVGILYFAYKYLTRPTEGLTANANCGGDSIHRGSVLGAIFGAALGTSWLTESLKSGLRDKHRNNKLSAHVDAFVAAVAKKGSSEFSSIKFPFSTCNALCKCRIETEHVTMITGRVVFNTVNLSHLTTVVPQPELKEIKTRYCKKVSFFLTFPSPRTVIMRLPDSGPSGPRTGNSRMITVLGLGKVRKNGNHLQ